MSIFQFYYVHVFICFIIIDFVLQMCMFYELNMNFSGMEIDGL